MRPERVNLPFFPAVLAAFCQTVVHFLSVLYVGGSLASSEISGKSSHPRARNLSKKGHQRWAVQERSKMQQGRHGIDTSRQVSSIFWAAQNVVKNCNETSGRRNHTAPGAPCSSEELCFAERNGGHKGNISVVDMVSLVL